MQVYAVCSVYGILHVCSAEEMNSNHTSSIDQYVNQLHDSAARGDVDGILNALKGAETTLRAKNWTIHSLILSTVVFVRCINTN